MFHTRHETTFEKPTSDIEKKNVFFNINNSL